MDDRELVKNIVGAATHWHRNPTQQTTAGLHGAVQALQDALVDRLLEGITATQATITTGAPAALPAPPSPRPYKPRGPMARNTAGRRAQAERQGKSQQPAATCKSCMQSFLPKDGRQKRCNKCKSAGSGVALNHPKAAKKHCRLCKKEFKPVADRREQTCPKCKRLEAIKKRAEKNRPRRKPGPKPRKRRAGNFDLALLDNLGEQGEIDDLCAR